MQLAKLGTAAAVCVAAMGCVDARDEYNDFDDRLVDAAGTGVDAPIVSTLPDVNGTWLVKAKPPVQGDYFFYFTTTVTFTPVTENTGHLAWMPQPLDYDEFVPVGDPLAMQEGDVDNTATAMLGMSGLLPGAANSVTQAEVNLDGQVTAHLQSADFICGTITGFAGTFPLEGSTFAATRYPGGDVTSDLALSVPHLCP